jgi:hypothetical protein
VLLLEIGEQGGETIALELVTERAIDVARKSSSANDLAGFYDELFFEGEETFSVAMWKSYSE